MLVTPEKLAHLVVGSVVWLILCLIIWAIVGSALYGFNPIFLGLVGWSLPFGVLASGLVIALLVATRRVWPGPVSAVFSALAAWAIALLIWASLWGPAYFSSSMFLPSAAVAAMGAIYAIFVFWPRRLEM